MISFLRSRNVGGGEAIPGTDETGVAAHCPARSLFALIRLIKSMVYISMDGEFFATEDFKLDVPEKGGGCSIGMVGAGRSGKTTALVYIMNKYFSKHIGVLFTGSPQIKEYQDINLIQSCQFQPRVIKTMYEINKDTNNHYKFLCVLDDIVDRKFDKEVLKCWTIYRNSDLSSVVSVQDVNLLNASGRNNINFLMLFKLNTDDRVERCIKAYLSSHFPKGMKMIDKVRWYKKNTEDHHFIFVDSLNDKIYRSRIDLSKK